MCRIIHHLTLVFYDVKNYNIKKRSRTKSTSPRHRPKTSAAILIYIIIYIFIICKYFKNILITKIKNIKASSCKTAGLCDIINTYNLKGGILTNEYIRHYC